MSGKIFIENYEGKSNTKERYEAWAELGLYRNLNTVWITPTRGTCGTRVAFSWMNVMGPPNAAVAKMCMEGFEVGKAYNEAITQILSSPVLSKFPYILTVEEDNTPSADSLLKLYKHIDKYDAVGGLYWIKGEAGVPMIWGNPEFPGTYAPQIPIENSVQECNGLGMGWTLFRTDMFKHSGFEFGRWFQTIADKNQFATQDLYFFKRAQELGFKFAVDTSCKIGHYDAVNGVIW